VSGGTQRSALEQRENDSAAKKKESGVDLSTEQYETDETEKSTLDYEQKLAEAGTRILNKNTQKLVEDAYERKTRRRDDFSARLEYNARQADRFANNDYGNRNGRQNYDRQNFGNYNRENHRENNLNINNYQQIIHSGDHEGKKLRSSNPFTDNYSHNKDENGKLILPTKPGYQLDEYGYRFVPRDPNAPILQPEVKGWLHCWTQTNGFCKPEYEIEVEGMPPRQKFTVSVSVTSRRGEPLDINPTVVNRSKKLGTTMAAYAFVDELVKRGLLKEDHAPKREESIQKTTTSGITDCNVLDTSQEATNLGGRWTLTNCILRMRKFCQMVKVPMDINMHAYGPDHDRKTDASFCIRFQIWGEPNIREYKCKFTTRNKKQAQAVVCLSIIRALYKDGLVEKHNARFQPPPKVNYRMSSCGDFDSENLTEVKEKYGGWIPANSNNAIVAILKNWNIPYDIPCTGVGVPGRDAEVYFKAELSLTLEKFDPKSVNSKDPKKVKTIKTKHELFAYGKKKGKNDAKNECACQMMRILLVGDPK